MNEQENSAQKNRAEQRDIDREIREKDSVIARTESDDMLLREIFKLHDTMSEIRGNMVDYTALKRDVAKHDALLYGDTKNMGAGGVIACLTTIKRDAALLAGFIGLVVSCVVAGIIDVLLKKH